MRSTPEERKGRIIQLRAALVRLAGDLEEESPQAALDLRAASLAMEALEAYSSLTVKLKPFSGELFECKAGHRFPESATTREGPDEGTGGLVLYLCPFCNPAETDPTAMPLSYIESLPATQEGWCAVTGNPCGTDTWTVGQPCSCPACQRYLRGLSRRDFAPAEGERTEAVANLEHLATQLPFDGPHRYPDKLHHAAVLLLTPAAGVSKEGVLTAIDQAEFEADRIRRQSRDVSVARLIEAAVRALPESLPSPAEDWHYLPELPPPTDGIMVPYLAWNAGYRGSQALPRIIWWKTGKILDLAKEWRDSGIYCWKSIEAAPALQGK